MVSKTPAFNLKAVLQETNLAADTLRAWERRYGLPLPQRTAGGHRLYSQRDIETIKWLIARQAEGLSISRAVDMWNEQLASGSDPLAGSVQKNVIPPSSMNLETIRRDWLTACFQYDTALAEQTLNQAFAANSVEITCNEVIIRGLYEIGELWHKGVVSVQQEHFASGIAVRRLEALISATPPPTRTETIIMACPSDEQHTFPLLLMTLFLRRRGWNVIYLGANVPTDRMEETVQAVHPKLVILSAQTLTTAISLREMARLLNQKGIKTAFGGRGFNHITGLQERIPAHFLGNTIEFAIPKIESLIGEFIPAPAEPALNKNILQLAAKYKQKRLLIETALCEDLQSRGQTIDYLDTANHFLGNALSAALELGDINYLSADMDWLVNLLIQHRVSVAYLPQFLQAYAQVTRKIMGESSQPIYGWLGLEVQKLTAVTILS
jgi:methanogenic corrinoid protein MtbC1